MSTDVRVPVHSGAGVQVIRGGVVVHDSAYSESVPGRLKNVEVWTAAMLEAVGVFAACSSEERELQLAACNQAVEKINEALGFLVEAKYREEPNGL